MILPGAEGVCVCECPFVLSNCNFFLIVSGCVLYNCK